MYFAWHNFNGWKIDAVLTCFVGLNFEEPKIDLVLMYFVRRNFDEQKIFANLTYFFFDITSVSEKSIISMYFFPPNFDGQKNRSCFNIFFDAVLMENWCKFELLILICFWITETRCRFDISFWKFFNISKPKAVWTSLLNLLSF